MKVCQGGAGRSASSQYARETDDVINYRLAFLTKGDCPPTGLSDLVEVPTDWGCCGFAGDRGLLHPELTASATATQAAQIRGLDAAAHASANRTCEIGMTRATKRPYAHIVEYLACAHALFPAPRITEPNKEH
ncbi:unannotated protein [freshwater metagenome]|uniref:Unannotated protein n=1 Tax=freshwater metagenome TaxID=449393 RepID=A0A6J7L7W5_9ZZZZ